MNVDALLVFREVFERLSFGASARALGLDPSVVSRRIKALEDELDVVLFLRSTRAMSATEAAEALYAHTAEALRTLEAAKQAVAIGASVLSGGIRLSAPTALGRARIGPVVHRFCRAHPEVSVEMLLSDRHIDLFEEGIDLAVRPAEPGSDSLIARRIGTSEQWAVASSDYLERYPAITEAPASLRGHDVVLRVVHGAVLDVRDALPDEVGATMRCRFRSDDIGAVGDAVIGGLGIGVIPRWFAESAVDRGELVRLPFAGPEMQAPVFAVLPAGRRTTARARALLELIVQDWATP